MMTKLTISRNENGVICDKTVKAWSQRPTRLNSTDELQRVFRQSPSSEIFRDTRNNSESNSAPCPPDRSRG